MQSEWEGRGVKADEGVGKKAKPEEEKKTHHKGDSADCQSPSPAFSPSPSPVTK